jgi:nitroreductase
MDTSAHGILTTLQRRFALKLFDPSRTVDEEKIETLMEVARLCPSSFGLQPYRLVVVQDRDKLLELYGCAMEQAQVRDCSHLFVLQARRHIDSAFIDAYMTLISETRGIGIEALSGLHANLMAGPGRDPAGREGMIWAQRQCYIVLGQLIMAAALLDLDTAPMEGFLAPRMDAAMGDEATWTTTVILAVGYAAQHAPPPSVKVRRPMVQFVRRF